MRIFREGHHTSNQPLIEVSGLCKQFKGSNAFAVSDVSFTAEKGEIIGLIGENGAGKSTLMRMLSTMLTPTGGSARICGFDVS
ncbi:MAG: ATP-binding cassette domain-containing protein, partial [Spirochaetales bacterium]|nr:ATP-binding cassette domain-containing protein [Spirochaetales bacterium]